MPRTFIALSVVVLGLLSPPVSAQGLQVTDDEVDAMVDALKGRELEPEQHDLLVRLGEAARTGDDVLPGDLQYAGWALVAADRPELGYPLVQQGVRMPPLLANDALRNLLLAVDYGQDGLARSIIEIARDINPVAARRLQRSIHQPELLEKAAKRARRQLAGGQTGEWAITSANDPASHLITWWLAPAGDPQGRAAVVLLPDAGRINGLPRDCQSAARLREAGPWLADGYIVVLPGLSGCDASDGLYLGPEDAARDVSASVQRLREELSPSEVILRGAGAAGLVVLELALRGVDADSFRSVSPLDPTAVRHLPSELTAALAIAPRAAALDPARVSVQDPHEALRAALLSAGVPILDGDEAPPRAGGKPGE